MYLSGKNEKGKIYIQSKLWREELPTRLDDIIRIYQKMDIQ